MPVIFDNDFLPTVGLRSPHIQSLLATTGTRRWLVKQRLPAVLEASQDMVVECSDGTKLQAHWSPHPEPRALVVLMPGWEGCHESTYLLSLAAHLYADGYSVFRLNTRDHGNSHHLNEGAFHTWRLQELVDGISYATKELAPELPAFLCAFSMGGNLAIRCVAMDDMRLTRAFTFNAPIQPKNVLTCLDGSPYKTYFVGHWKESLAKKQAAFPDVYDFVPAEKMKTVEEICNYVIEQGYGPCSTLAEYLEGYAVTDETILNLKAPMTIVTSKDDPIIPVDDYLALPETDNTEMIITQYGGHCGFIAGPRLNTLTYDIVSKRIEDAIGSGSAAEASPSSRLTKTNGVANSAANSEETDAAA